MPIDPPAAPDGGEPVAARRSRRFAIAVSASLALHGAVAYAFFGSPDEIARLEGGEQGGIVLLGDAQRDEAAASGRDAEAVTVSLVPLLRVERVTETISSAVERAALAPVQTEQPAKPTPAIRSENAAMTPIRPLFAARPETATAAEPERIAALADADAEPDSPEGAAQTAPGPDVLKAAVDREAEAAPKLEPSGATAAIAALDRARPAETSSALQRPADAPAPDRLKGRTIEPEPAKPQPARNAKPASAAKARPQNDGATATARTTQQKRTPPGVADPAGGSAVASTRRGAAGGARDGTRLAANAAAGAATSGNAAASNYPGRVVQKLRRALRYPDEARRQRLTGEVQVAFTVGASGSVAGLRVVRSSGSPVLDRAALETVRRAAPFPAIPDGAGRTSWPFTVPLAFSR